MALYWPTFFTRLGSAIVFSAVMLAGLLWHEWAFFLLTAAIQALCLREYCRIMPKIFPQMYQPQWLPWAVQLFSLAALAAAAGAATRMSVQLLPALLFLPTVILLAATLSAQTPLQSAFTSLGSVFYITLPLLLFFSLRTISVVIPLALVLMIWMNDTMAYLVGSFIGKTPFSKISPKKTWEGTAGGAILTIAGAAVWGFFSPYYSMIDWMALALCASVAGTAGDLLESKLKRLADLKDSGSLMPGHGGALDRFDSLLVATPFAFCYAYLFMPPLPLEIF